MEESLNFGEAIEVMRDGGSIRLPKWLPDVIIRLQVPDSKSKMTHSYFYVTSRFGMVPWIPTMVEMLSLDWEKV